MLRDVLLLQKREVDQRSTEAYVERRYDSKRLPPGLVKVVIGPRRAGKSTFALHMMRGGGSFGYVSFDDERLADLKTTTRS
jgi:uncharacterized protein